MAVEIMFIYDGNTFNNINILGRFCVPAVDVQGLPASRWITNERAGVAFLASNSGCE